MRQPDNQEAPQKVYNVLALYKGSEKYIYVFDDDAARALVDHIQNTAANPEYSLNWFDAQVLTRRAYEAVMRNPK